MEGGCWNIIYLRILGHIYWKTIILNIILIEILKFWHIFAHFCSKYGNFWKFIAWLWGRFIVLFSICRITTPGKFWKNPKPCKTWVHLQDQNLENTIFVPNYFGADEKCAQFVMSPRLKMKDCSGWGEAGRLTTVGCLSLGLFAILCPWIIQPSHPHPTHHLAQYFFVHCQIQSELVLV